MMLFHLIVAARTISAHYATLKTELELQGTIRVKIHGENVGIHPSRAHSFAFVPPLNVSEELSTGKSLRLPAYLLKTVVP